LKNVKSGTKNGSSDDVLQSQSPLELYNIWVCSSQNMDSKNVYCSAQIKLNTLVLGVFYSSVVSHTGLYTEKTPF